MNFPACLRSLCTGLLAGAALLVPSWSGAQTLTYEISLIASNTDTTVSLYWHKNHDIANTAYRLTAGEGPIRGRVFADLPASASFMYVTGVTGPQLFTLAAVLPSTSTPTWPAAEVVAGPMGLSATASKSTEVVLSWPVVPALSAGGWSYRITRNGVPIYTAAPGASAYTDSGLQPDTVYRWAVAAVRPNAYGPGNDALARTLMAPPTNFSMKRAWATSLELSWTPAAGATGYEVMDGTRTYAINLQTGTFKLTGLRPSEPHTLRLRTVRGTDKGEPTLPMTYSTLPYASPPANLTVAYNTDGSPHLTWPMVSGVTGYHISRDGVRINSLPVTTTAYDDRSELNIGSDYIYKVWSDDPDPDSQLFFEPPTSPAAKAIARQGTLCYTRTAADHVAEKRAVKEGAYYYTRGTKQQMGTNAATPLFGLVGGLGYWSIKGTRATSGSAC